MPNSVKDNLNSHKVVYGFALLFVVLSLVWIIGLSGAQTGSSTVLGSGSILSMNPTDDPDPTYEIVVEAASILFFGIGVAMFVYYYTKSNIAGKLAESGLGAAALEIDGKTDVRREDKDNAKREEIGKLSSELGPQPMNQQSQQMYK